MKTKQHKEHTSGSATVATDEGAPVQEGVKEAPQAEEKAQDQQSAAEVSPATETAATAAPQPAEDRKFRPNPNRKYVLLATNLSDWGRVPQQQADIAKIISANFKVGDEVSEADLFCAILKDAPSYKQLQTSVQDPRHLFRYYNRLPSDGKKHAGFLARGFLEQKEEHPAAKAA